MSQTSPQQPERPQIMTRRELRELRAAQAAAQGQSPASPSQSAPPNPTPGAATRRQQRESRSALSAVSAASAPQAPTGVPPRVAIPRAATGVRSLDPRTGEFGGVEATGQFPAVTPAPTAGESSGNSPSRPSVSDILARAAQQEADRTGQDTWTESPSSVIEPPLTRRSRHSAHSAISAGSAFSAVSAQPSHSVPSAQSVESPPRYETAGDEVWPTQVPFPHPEETPQASFEEILAAEDDEETDELDHRFDWKHWLMLMCAAAVIGVLVWLLVGGGTPDNDAAFGVTHYMEATFSGTPTQGELW